MGAIQRIIWRLQEYPELVCRVSGEMVTVEPQTPDGFPVSLAEGQREWVVSLGGWHEHFESEDEALNCFAFGLSGSCRLRVHYRGSYPYRWAVERRTGDGWREESTVGLLFFPFWRRLRVVYCQNVPISTFEAGTAHDPADM
jgi:hypothetical protein